MVQRVALWGAAALATLAAASPPPAAAIGACQVIERGSPARAPGAPRPPLLVGDSSTLLAVAPLARLGIAADARGCRQADAAVDLLAARRRAGTLPRVAILAVGANGAIADRTLRRARTVLGPRRVLGLVTPATSPQSAAAMRRAAAARPRTTVLIDWARTGLWRRYGGDGIHIGYAGEAVLARFVWRHVRPYVPPRRRLRLTADPAVAKNCGTVRRRGTRVEVVVVRGRDRVLCARARALVAARRPAALDGWRWLDWSVVGRPPWSDVFVRGDGRVVVAARRAARRGRGAAPR